jgi:hypothetical protein
MKKLTLFLATALLFFGVKAQIIPKLNSLPTATATLYLDFDGQVTTGTLWMEGSTIISAPSTLTTAQITEVFNRVGEDFRPFAINITTDSAVYLTAPINRRNRIIITPSSTWAPGVGGLAYFGSFALNDDVPAFVFSDRLGPNSGKMIAECCSHEAGHTLGLQHQSKYDTSNCAYPVQEYYSGIGTGQIGWSPIMGNSYYRNMTSWNYGQNNLGCTNYEDNLSLITNGNGFTYRTDDYNDNMNGSTTPLNGNSFSLSGVITTSTDVDAFKFTLNSNSNILLNVIPYNIALNYVGANLDIKVELYNSSGALLRSYNPADIMAVNIDTVLNSGTYYVKVDGTGNINIGDYGSLGQYTISGTISSLPIHSVVLRGEADKNKHNLNWKIIADEAIEKIVIESSKDAIAFKAVASLSGTADKFTNINYEDVNMYYRLRVISIIHQTVYSNTISLKSSAIAPEPFVVSTLVTEQIRVTAAKNYLYRLLDLSGKVITNGNGIAGNNFLNIGAMAKGIYVLQLFVDDKGYSKKIVKN